LGGVGHQKKREQKGGQGAQVSRRWLRGANWGRRCP
jgi:hypothetical protein